MKKLENIKKYSIWFMVWVLSIGLWTYASNNGTIWELFEYINDTIWWQLVWSNIKDGTVGSSQLGANSVMTEKILNSAVTTSKIANDAVTTAKLANNSVNNAKLNNTDTFTMAWLNVSWNARATAFLYTSDERYKKNINTIDNSLDKILSLRWVEWTWKNNDKKDIWFIAQEVESVLPEIVNTDNNWYKSVQYGNIVWLLVEWIKEQQGIINDLLIRLEALENN